MFSLPTHHHDPHEWNVRLRPVSLLSTYHPFRRSPLPYVFIYNSPAFTHKFAQTKNVKYRKWVIPPLHSRDSLVVENHDSSYHCTFCFFSVQVSLVRIPSVVSGIDNTHTALVENWAVPLINAHRLNLWTDPHRNWNSSIGVCWLGPVSVTTLVPGNYPIVVPYETDPTSLSYFNCH